MTPAEMKSIQDAHVAAEARKDIQGALAGYREDCYYQNVGLNFRVDGKQRVGVYYQAGWQAFPDGEVTIEGEAFGEDVAVHWGTFRATNKGSFMGVEPTGRKVAIPVISVLTFRDGLMQGEHLLFDVATFCEQLGVSVELAREAVSGWNRISAPWGDEVTAVSASTAS